MPFNMLIPSIGLGLLKSAIGKRGIRTRVEYLTLPFAKRIGVDAYQELALKTVTFDLVGEWLFSEQINERRPSRSEYVEQVLRAPYDGQQKYDPGFAERVEAAREHIPAFLDACVQSVLNLSPEIIGFTSIFQQHVASLALAKRIKALAPHIKIVMGGANCEALMGIETVRQFEQVDVVVSGEGDLVFTELVERLLLNKQVEHLQGVFTRNNIDALISDPMAKLTAPSVMDMDALPYPDYSDFFNQIDAHNLADMVCSRVLFETSRGCWWGEKHHCTFCGLNGSTMTFRSKSATRALDELTHLSNAYPTKIVSVVDNIMDMGYFNDFVPQLAERNMDLQLFYEVKANLRKEQISALSRAGITEIQPGIESLSSNVLRLMRKGIKALQNVQLLKWCKEFRVTPQWNILWGFPQETAEDYSASEAIARLISHLYPPASVGEIRLDRFSPNFDEAVARGFHDVVPYPAYSFIYADLTEKARANLAYYFTFSHGQTNQFTSEKMSFRKSVVLWKREHASSDLFYVDKGELILVWDFRSCAINPLTVLRGEVADVMRACDGIMSERQLGAMLASKRGVAVSPELIAEILTLTQSLCDKGFMLRESNSYLALPIALGRYTPNREVLEKLLAQSEALAGRDHAGLRIRMATNSMHTEVALTAPQIDLARA
jgi:ribosomal peptide maturation radical SAM protein 1